MHFTPMKKVVLFLSFVFSSIVLNAQDLKSYIPENSTFIVKVNGARINNNVNFDEIRATEMYKDFLFKIMNKKTAEERAITTLLETPDETGLNIKADMYYYDIPDNTAKQAKESKKSKKKDEYEYDEYDYEQDNYSEASNPMYVVAIPLLNSKKFASFISDIFYRNNKAKIVKAGKGISFIKNYSTLIVWTTDKVFFCMLPYKGYGSNGYSQGDIKKVIKLVTTPLTSKSVLTNTRILNGLGVDSDIAYAFNSNAWSKNPWLFDEINRSETIKDSSLINADLFKDNYSFSYANFEKGRITFTGNQFYGKKLASIFNPIFNLKPSAKLASIVYQTPVTSYISYAFSFTEVQKFVDKTFNYNMDTILIDVIKSERNIVFETDPQIRKYRKEIDTIDYIVNGPDEVEENYYGEEQSTITDSGTVYQDSDVAAPYEYDSYNSGDAKYEHETLNWYQLDSLEQRQDTLYTMIENRKDTLAVKTYQGLGIKGEELWHIFNGEFIFLYHAMTSVEKKSKVYEMDDEYNYVEVEKTKTIPMPLYSLAATINNDSLFNKYLALMVQKGFIQKEKNRYLVVLGDMNQYIWVDKSVCILTNDNNFNPTKHKATSQSSYEIENFNRITAHQSGAYIEVGKILASSVQFVEDKQTAEVLEILAKYFDETIYITDFDTNTNVSTKMDIIFNDDQKNSINIVVQMMDEIYVHFTKK